VLKVSQTVNALADETGFGLFRWSQYLQFSEVNGTIYFDEGNGAAVPK
jgi:hypothetical protein